MVMAARNSLAAHSRTLTVPEATAILSSASFVTRIVSHHFFLALPRATFLRWRIVACYLSVTKLSIGRVNWNRKTQHTAANVPPRRQLSKFATLNVGISLFTTWSTPKEAQRSNIPHTRSHMSGFSRRFQNQHHMLFRRSSKETNSFQFESVKQGWSVSEAD